MNNYIEVLERILEDKRQEFVKLNRKGRLLLEDIDAADREIYGAIVFAIAANLIQTDEAMKFTDKLVAVIERWYKRKEQQRKSKL